MIYIFLQINIHCTGHFWFNFIFRWTEYPNYPYWGQVVDNGYLSHELASKLEAFILNTCIWCCNNLCRRHNLTLGFLTECLVPSTMQAIDTGCYLYLMLKKHNTMINVICTVLFYYIDPNNSHYITPLNNSAQNDTIQVTTKLI